jgi:hypothetical protein
MAYFSSSVVPMNTCATAPCPIHSESDISISWDGINVKRSLNFCITRRLEGVLGSWQSTKVLDIAPPAADVWIMTFFLETQK